MRGTTAEKVKIDPKDRLISHEEAALKLGRTPKALYEMCYKGQGPKHVWKEGRKRFYLESEVLAMMVRGLVVEGESA